MKKVWPGHDFWADLRALEARLEQRGQERAAGEVSPPPPPRPPRDWDADVRPEDFLWLASARLRADKTGFGLRGWDELTAIHWDTLPAPTAGRRLVVLLAEATGSGLRLEAPAVTVPVTYLPPRERTPAQPNRAQRRSGRYGRDR